MGFVRLTPYRMKNDARRLMPIEFGVGDRPGMKGKCPVLQCLLRLRPVLLGEGFSFLVADGRVNVSFDAGQRKLLIEPGTDFKFYEPGGLKSKNSPLLLLGFPLPEGVRTQKFVLPVATFKAAPGAPGLVFVIPDDAFGQAAPAAAPVVAAAAPPVVRAPAPAAAASVPVPAPGKKQPYVGVLARQPHDVRRGT